jgi:prepilin-type N-terminal cleavage/methylation domain-containing protein
MRVPRVPRVPRPTDDDGFSLIEVMVAIILMVMLASVVAAGLTTVLSLDRGNRSRSVAASLVEQQINATRLAVTASNASYGTTNLSPAPVVNGTTFTITTAIEPVSLGAGSSPCAGGVATGSGMTVVRVTVTATWNRMGGIKPVREDTQVSPKAPLGTTTSNIGISVTNAAGGPVAGHNVSLSPGSASTMTDSDGCAFFAGLTAGTAYTGTVNDTGWVGTDLKQTAAKLGGTPAAGQTAVGQIIYDNAASLALSMPGTGPAYGAYVMPANMPYTLTASGLKTGGPAQVGTCYGSQTCYFNSGTTYARTVTGLFPFATYSGWIGDCPGANAAADSFSMTPGGTTTASVLTGGAVDLIATKTGSVPQQTVTMSLSGCGPAPTVIRSYPVGTTPAGVGSAAVHAWMPYGTWTVKMVNSANVTTTSTVTITPANTLASPASVSVPVP